MARKAVRKAPAPKLFGNVPQIQGLTHEQSRWLEIRKEYRRVPWAEAKGPDQGQAYLFPSGKLIEHTRDAVLGNTKGAVVVERSPDGGK
jgi:hypothetical protein